MGQHHAHQSQPHQQNLQFYGELELAKIPFIFINLECLVFLRDHQMQNKHEMLDWQQMYQI
jgi:hypothetical protein